jgi:hypothetical protein
VTYLFYWYGTEKESDYYGYATPHKFVPYKKEMQKTKSVHKLPERIQAKVDANTPLNQKEAEVFRRYNEMEEDLRLEPSERRRGVKHFSEMHEVNDDNSDDDDVVDAKHHDADLDPVEGLHAFYELDNDTNGKSSTTKQAKAKATKEKRGSVKKDEVEPVDRTRDAASSTDARRTTKAKRGRLKASERSFNLESDQLDQDISESTGLDVEISPRGKRGRPKEIIDESTNEETAESTIVDTFVTSKGKRNTSTVEYPPDMPNLEPSKSDRNMDENASKSPGVTTQPDEEIDKLKDDDRSIGYALEEALSSHDEADDEFVENNTKNKNKRTDRIAKTKKVKPAKKIQHSKIKASKPLVEKRSKLKEKDVKKKEADDFRSCEESYWELLKRWKVAIDTRSFERLQELMTEVSSVVEGFCATFIRVYRLGDILKETRRLLKDAQEDMTSYHALKGKLRATYELKEPALPSGFTLKPSKPDLLVSANHERADRTPHVNGLDLSQRSVASTDDLPVPTNGVKSPRALRGTDDPSEKTEPKPIPLKSPLRVGSQTSTGEISGTLRVAGQPKAAQRKFTLGSFMRPAAKETVDNDASVVDETKQVCPSTEPTVPSWVKGPTVVDAPVDYPRSLALEFLIQMAEHLPEGSVNIDSLARSIEAAIFDWSRKESSHRTEDWTRLYWTKTHALVAAICGKTDKGAIQDLLLQGHFDLPEKLVTLPAEKLAASFEGHPPSF